MSIRKDVHRTLIESLNKATAKLKGKTPREYALMNLSEAMTERDEDGFFTGAAQWATQKVLEYTDGSPSVLAKLNVEQVQFAIAVQYDPADSSAKSTYLPRVLDRIPDKSQSCATRPVTKLCDLDVGSGKQSRVSSPRFSKSRVKISASDGSSRSTSSRRKSGGT